MERDGYLHMNMTRPLFAPIRPRASDLDEFIRAEMKRRGYWEYENYLAGQEALRMKENLRRELEGFGHNFVRSTLNPDGSVRNHDRVERELERREREGALNDRGRAVLNAYRKWRK